MIRKLLVYDSYTLFWQKLRFEIFGRVRGGPPRSIFSDFGDQKKKKKVVANSLRMVQFSEKINKIFLPKVDLGDLGDQGLDFAIFRPPRLPEKGRY